MIEAGLEFDGETNRVPAATAGVKPRLLAAKNSLELSSMLRDWR